MKDNNEMIDWLKKDTSFTGEITRISTFDSRADFDGVKVEGFRGVLVEIDAEATCENGVLYFALNTFSRDEEPDESYTIDGVQTPFEGWNVSGDARPFAERGYTVVMPRR